tara:strand:+ start:138 stop:338 length:201 start_codon:yes stop_codon:yes gene_type:complete
MGKEEKKEYQKKYYLLKKEEKIKQEKQEKDLIFINKLINERNKKEEVYKIMMEEYDEMDNYEPHDF